MTPTETDREAQRDRFRRIAVEVEPALIKRALRLTGDKDEAWDLVQTTLERGYRSIGRFNEGSHATAWLMTIMTHHFIDSCRHAQLLKRCGPVDLTEMESPAPEPVPVWADLELGDVRWAARKLPERFRRPFELQVFERLSLREVGARLGLPLGTTCSRLLRARERLRRILLAKLATGDGADGDEAVSARGRRKVQEHAEV